MWKWVSVIYDIFVVCYVYYKIGMLVNSLDECFGDIFFILDDEVEIWYLLKELFF